MIQKTKIKNNYSKFLLILKKSNDMNGITPATGVYPNVVANKKNDQISNHISTYFPYFFLFPTL
jgi:hypothetical protein